MTRALLIALAVTALAGVGVVLLDAGRSERTVAYATNNFPAERLVALKPGQRICQATMIAPQDLRAVTLVVAPGVTPRGPVTVTARAAGRDPGRPGAVIAQGGLSRRVLTGQPVTVRLDRTVRAERSFALCVQQSGPERVQVWGQFKGDGLRGPTASDAYVDDKPLEADVWLEFPVVKPRSALSRVSQAFDNAAPFKLGGMGAWTLWLLAAIVVVGVPVLLGIGAVRAAAEDG